MTPQLSRPLPDTGFAPHWLVKLDTLLFFFTLALLLAYWLSVVFGSSVFLFELFTHFQVQFLVLGGLLAIYFFISSLLIRTKVLALPDSFSVGLFFAPRTTAVFMALIVSIMSGYEIKWWLNQKPETLPTGYHDTLRVFHANVLYTRTEYGSTITLIKQQTPDFYVLQEMTPASIRQVIPQLKNQFPYWFACWSKGPCWILVGSRTPIAIDKKLARQKRIIKLHTRVRGRAMSLITVHPRTPVLPSWFAERNEQLQLAARQTADNPLPTVLLGDFNISVFSPVFKAIFNDGSTPRSCRAGFGLQPTWPRFIPLLMIPIDHAFVNRGFRPRRFCTLDQPGSDHRAIVADVDFVK